MDVLATEEPFAKRAFEAGMWAAALHAAEPHAVALTNALPVEEVGGQVFVFAPAGRAGADGVVTGHVEGVAFAERAATVLARFGGRLGATVEPAADLALC